MDKIKMDDEEETDNMQQHTIRKRKKTTSNYHNKEEGSINNIRESSAIETLTARVAKRKKTTDSYTNSGSKSTEKQRHESFTANPKDDSSVLQEEREEDHYNRESKRNAQPTTLRAVTDSKKTYDTYKDEERRAANRRSAFRSRERRKILIEELQNQVKKCSSEGDELRKRNVDLQTKLELAMHENQLLKRQASTCDPVRTASSSSSQAAVAHNVTTPAIPVQSAFPTVAAPGAASTDRNSSIQSGNDSIASPTATTTLMLPAATSEALSTGVYNNGGEALMTYMGGQVGTLNNNELGSAGINRQQPVSIQIPFIIPSLNMQLMQQPTTELVTNSNNNITNQQAILSSFGNTISEVPQNPVAAIIQALLANQTGAAGGSQDSAPESSNPNNS